MLFSDNTNLSKKGHFIYFYNQKSKRSTEWDLMRFVAVKSFATHNPDYEVNFYTNELPTGEYWERASEYCKLHLVTPEDSIFGNTLHHPAHISDVFRIKLLISEGGVYSDFDTITIKNFDSLLQRNVHIVGDLSNRRLTMGNGVIIAPPNSEYLTTWLDLWKDFRSKGKDRYWDELSVKVHRNLSKYPDLAGTFEIVNSDFFYPYSHYKTKELFHEYKPEKITPNTYSVHLYDSQNITDVNLHTEKEIIENPTKSSHTWLINQYL